MVFAGSSKTLREREADESLRETTVGLQYNKTIYSIRSPLVFSLDLHFYGWCGVGK